MRESCEILDPRLMYTYNFCIVFTCELPVYFELSVRNDFANRGNHQDIKTLKSRKQIGKF